MTGQFYCVAAGRTSHLKGAGSVGESNEINLRWFWLDPWLTTQTKALVLALAHTHTHTTDPRSRITVGTVAISSRQGLYWGDGLTHPKWGTRLQQRPFWMRKMSEQGLLETKRRLWKLTHNKDLIKLRKGSKKSSWSQVNINTVIQRTGCNIPETSFLLSKAHFLYYKQ